MGSPGAYTFSTPREDKKQKGPRLTTRFSHAVSRSPCLGSSQESNRLLASGSAEALRLPCEVNLASGWSGDHAVFVPGYSGGPATDSHRVPYFDSNRRADSLKAPRRWSSRPKGLVPATSYSHPGAERTPYSFPTQFNTRSPLMTIGLPDAKEYNTSGHMSAPLGQTMVPNSGSTRTCLK
jgi:hypothetical protein